MLFLSRKEFDSILPDFEGKETVWAWMVKNFGTFITDEHGEKFRMMDFVSVEDVEKRFLKLIESRDENDPTVQALILLIRKCKELPQ